MDNRALVAIIVLLVSSHYASVLYRLHNAEEKIDKMNNQLSQSALAAANAATAAAVVAQQLIRQTNERSQP